MSDHQQTGKANLVLFTTAPVPKRLNFPHTLCSFYQAPLWRSFVEVICDSAAPLEPAGDATHSSTEMWEPAFKHWKLFQSQSSLCPSSREEQVWLMQHRRALAKILTNIETPPHLQHLKKPAASDSVLWMKTIPRTQFCALGLFGNCKILCVDLSQILNLHWLAAMQRQQNLRTAIVKNVQSRKTDLSLILPGYLAEKCK